MIFFTYLFLFPNPSEDDRGKFWKLSWKDLKIFLSVETFQVVTKPEQKLLPKYLLFLGTWRITSSPQMPKVWSKPKKLSHKAEILKWRKPLGTGIARFLVTARKVAGDPIRDAPQTSLFLHCPSLSTPVNQRELQSLPFLQVAERSTMIKDKRAVLPLCPSWIRLQLIPGATSDRVQICLHRDRLNESKQCNWFQTCS